MVAPEKKISAVVTLLVVAPLVAEYLLGDLPLKLLPVMIIMAPMYGGGAVLIREVARRTGRGWPMMLLLGVAYMLIEEGLVGQSLFNHDYLKMQMHLLDQAYIPAFGIGGWCAAYSQRGCRRRRSVRGPRIPSEAAGSWRAVVGSDRQWGVPCGRAWFDCAGYKAGVTLDGGGWRLPNVACDGVKRRKPQRWLRLSAFQIRVEISEKQG
jgi:hypothetical protein